MTGGFYDYRRSKLKLLSVIRENNKLVNVKQQELTKVRAELQNILLTLLHLQCCLFLRYVMLYYVFL